MAWYHVYLIPATTRMLLVSTTGRPIWPLHMANNALIVYLWFGTSCYTCPNQLMWCTQKTYERLSLWSQAEWIISLCQTHRCFLWLCLTTSKRVPHTDRVGFALVCETNVPVCNASEKLCIMFAASSRPNTALWVSPWGYKRNRGICDAYMRHWGNGSCSSRRIYATPGQDELMIIFRTETSHVSVITGTFVVHHE